MLSNSHIPLLSVGANLLLDDWLFVTQSDAIPDDGFHPGAVVQENEILYGRDFSDNHGMTEILNSLDDLISPDLTGNASKRLKSNNGNPVEVTHHEPTYPRSETPLSKEPDVDDFPGGLDSNDFMDAILKYWRVTQGNSFAKVAELYNNKFNPLNPKSGGAIRRRYHKVYGNPEKGKRAKSKMNPELSKQEIDNVFAEAGSNSGNGQAALEVPRPPQLPATTDVKRKRSTPHSRQTETRSIYKWRIEEKLGWDEIRRRLEENYGWYLSKGTVQVYFCQERTAVEKQKAAEGEAEAVAVEGEIKEAAVEGEAINAGTKELIDDQSSQHVDIGDGVEEA